MFKQMRLIFININMYLHFVYAIALSVNRITYANTEMLHNKNMAFESYNIYQFLLNKYNISKS